MIPIKNCLVLIFLVAVPALAQEKPSLSTLNGLLSGFSGISIEDTGKISADFNLWKKPNAGEPEIFESIARSERKGGVDDPSSPSEHILTVTHEKSGKVARISGETNTLIAKPFEKWIADVDLQKSSPTALTQCSSEAVAEGICVTATASVCAKLEAKLESYEGLDAVKTKIDECSALFSDMASFWNKQDKAVAKTHSLEFSGGSLKDAKFINMDAGTANFFRQITGLTMLNALCTAVSFAGEEKQSVQEGKAGGKADGALGQ